MKKPDLKYLAIITILTAILFIPSFKNEITNWDDEKYIRLNTYIHELNQENFKSIWSVYYLGNYHPLTMLSYAFDYKVAGDSPWIYHLSNLLFHILNTVLVFLLVLRLLRFRGMDMATGKESLIAGIASLLFGIHTLHVESVLWISERKDVLYTFFFLLASIKYIDFLQKGKLKFYLITILFFILSLLSKGMAASFAVTLFLFDYIADRKILSKKVIVEKLPFLALALVFGVIAIKAQQSTDAVGDYQKFNIIDRILFAGYGFMQYIFKTILPVNLSSMYEYPLKNGNTLPVKFYLIPLLIIPVIYLFIKQKNNKPLVFGILFFLFNIFLVLQLLPVGNAIMADRYYYVPSIGFFFLAGVYFTKFSKESKSRLLPIAGIAFIILLSFLTVKRQEVWKNSLTLWDDVIEKNKNISIAYNNRGIVKSDMNDLQGALKDYTSALEINPNYLYALNNRADVRQDLGDYKGAIADLDKALELDPNYVTAYNTRGNTRKAMGQVQLAIEDYNKAIELDKNYANAYYNRGGAKNAIKDNSCIEDFDKAIELNPYFLDAYVARGLAYKSMGKLEEALKDMDIAEKIGANFMVYVNRGNVKIDLNDLEGAKNDFAKAIAINPSSSLAYQNYGVVCFKQNDSKNAIKYMQLAIQYNNKNAVAFYVSGVSKLRLGIKEEACKELTQALNLGFKSAANELNQYCR